MVRNGNKVGSCSVPIEYVPGDLVAAKLTGYCPWPGMIEICPEEPDVMLQFKRKRRDKTEYHVNYFGRKVYRSWVEQESIQPLTTEYMNENRTKKSLIPAIKEAEEALKLSPEDRLKTFNFSKRNEALQDKKAELIDTTQQDKKRKKKVNGNLHSDVSITKKRKVKEEVEVNDDDKTNECVSRGTRRSNREVASSTETPKREMRSSKKLKASFDKNKKNGTAHSVSSESEAMMNGHEITKEELPVNPETNAGPSLVRENVSLTKHTDLLTICKDDSETVNDRLSPGKIVPSVTEETQSSTLDKVVCVNNPLLSEESSGLSIADEAANLCENEPVSREESVPLAAEERNFPIVNGIEHCPLSDVDDLDFEDNSEDTELASQTDGEIPPESSKKSYLLHSEREYLRYLQVVYGPSPSNSVSFSDGKNLYSSANGEEEDSNHLADNEDSSGDSKNSVDPNLNQENTEQVSTNQTSENPSNYETGYFGFDNEIDYLCMRPHENFILGNL